MRGKFFNKETNNMRLVNGSILFGEHLDWDWVTRRYYFKVIRIGSEILVRELQGWYDSYTQEVIAPTSKFGQGAPILPIKSISADSWEITLEGGLDLSLTLYTGDIYVDQGNGKYRISQIKQKLAEAHI